MQPVEQSKLPDLTEQLQKARKLTWDALERIASRLESGMTESDARRIGQQTLAEMGSRKFWHKCHIRFGESTVRSFDDDYVDAVLQDEDILYIDIGPIWNGIEGDAGATFVRGTRNAGYLKCKQDVETVFAKTADVWRRENLSGPALYEFADQQAKSLGWILTPSYVRGHRLGEFPHSFYTKSSLTENDFTPAPARWVLEVQICDPSLKFGAFYEDILQ